MIICIFDISIPKFMNIYTVIKRFNKIDNIRLKLLALWGFHVLGKRYIGVFLDPVMACNLRCKMCYFSDEKKRKELKGLMNDEQVKKISNALFHKALKVQIGCGAEPTLYKHLPEIVAEAKKKNVPYISLTTNANLLTEKLIDDCLSAGLDEFTISLHGVTKDIYEYFMTNASYEVFCNVLKMLSSAKDRYNFKIRINYTINEQNLEDLALLFDKFGNIKIDILQLRPIQNIGDAEYENFDHTKLIEKYESVIDKVKKEAVTRNITCIAPSRKQIEMPDNENNNGVISDYTYCYVSPSFCWKPDFNIETDTFDTYSKRTKVAKNLFLSIFHTTKDMDKRKKHLNYQVN